MTLAFMDKGEIILITPEIIDMISCAEIPMLKNIHDDSHVMPFSTF